MTRSQLLQDRGDIHEYPTQTDALILVHPLAVPRGADLKLRLWWQLLDSWSGQVYILQGPGLDASASPAASTLSAIIDALDDEAASRGKDCIWDGASEPALTVALDAIIPLLEPSGHITVTGAFAEDSIIRVAKRIHHSGFEVSIDDSVLWRDEVDWQRDLAAKERLKKLMAVLPPPQD